MRIKLLNLMTIFMVAIVSIGFSSCDEKEDNSVVPETPTTPNNPYDNVSIIQTLRSYKWVMTDTTFDTWSDQMSRLSQVWIFYFTSDNEGVIHYQSTERDTYSGTSNEEEHINFTYNVEDNKVYIHTGWGYADWELTYYGSYMKHWDDMILSAEMTSSDYEYLRDDSQGYHGSEGKIDAQMVFEMKLKGVNKLENGWYSYIMEYRIGATEDAYKKGVTQMHIKMWSSNGTLQSGFKTSDYGKPRTFSYYITLSDLVYLDRNLVLSKERSIVLNYEVEYYNSKDNEWYSLKTGQETLSAQ